MKWTNPSMLQWQMTYIEKETKRKSDSLRKRIRSQNRNVFKVFVIKELSY